MSEILKELQAWVRASSLSPERAELLSSRMEHLSGPQLLALMVALRSSPQAPRILAAYAEALEKESGPLSPTRLEMLLSAALGEKA